MDIVCYSLIALISYLLGSLPTGFLAGKAKGLDIRTMGSGNIGATNVFRILGRKAGIFVLLVDALKGFVACRFAGSVVMLLLGIGSVTDPELERQMIVAGIAAILGHNYTCWLKFKGGKGIATSAGVLAALLPKAFLIILLVWIVVFLISRYVSLASIAAAVSLPIATWLVGRNLMMIIIAALIGALAVYKHRANIQRLLEGTEHRFKKKPASQPTP